MNIDKFTQKSIEAVNGCEKLAMEYGILCIYEIIVVESVFVGLVPSGVNNY